MLRDTLIYIFIVATTFIIIGCNKETSRHSPPVTSSNSAGTQNAGEIKSHGQSLEDDISLKLLGIYEFRSGPFVTQYVFTKFGYVSNFRNNHKAWEGHWGTKGKKIMVTKPTGSVMVFELKDDGSITHIANISDQTKTDFEELYQTQYVKTTNNPTPPKQETAMKSDQTEDSAHLVGHYRCETNGKAIVLSLADNGVAEFLEQGKVTDQGQWVLKGKTLVVFGKTKKAVLQTTDSGDLNQTAVVSSNGLLIKKQRLFKRSARER